MKLLEEYISELSVDVQIDEFSMKDVQMKLPAIKHKWTGRLMRAKMEIEEKTAELHPDVKETWDQINELKLVVEFLEKTEKTLSSITFDIRNIVEIIKLETQ